VILATLLYGLALSSLPMPTLLLQEPAPQEPTPEVQSQEPEQPQAQGVDPSELEQAFAAVTQGFAKLDKLLSGTVEKLSEQQAGAAADPGSGGLAAASASAGQLLADMEHLLAVLPAPPPPPPSGGSGQSKQPPQQSQSDSKPEPDDKEGKDKGKDKPQGQSPPPEAPLQSVLRDPRAGQWGALPPRLQQAIDNASADDLPLRYRRWLVEYHRHGQDG